MKEITFGECPVCRQGVLFAGFSPLEGKLVLICDDCGSQWSSPVEAQSYENTLQHEFSDIRPATLEELRFSNW